MEISEFRERMKAYVVGDQATLDDEEWWAQTTDLALLVLAERTRVKRERARSNPIYRAWQERKAQPLGNEAPDVEAHRFSFEGSTSLLARHLIHDHGVPPGQVVQWSGGLTKGDWTAFDDMHRVKHSERGEDGTHGEGE